jgi:hypothetical protein
LPVVHALESANAVDEPTTTTSNETLSFMRKAWHVVSSRA